MYRGNSYTTHIKRVLSCDFRITLANGNINGGGGFWKKIVCYFRYPSTPPTLLMLESPNLYTWYPYAYRCWQHIWNFSPSSSFEKFQILVILLQNAISLWIIREIVLKIFKCMGGGGVIYIIYQTGFTMWFSNHPQKSKYWWRGWRVQFLFDNFERKLFVTSVTHQLLSYYWC